MMSRNEIMTQVREIERRHAGALDGGHTLVQELLQYLGRHALEERQEIRQVLLGLVAKQEPTLWGVALEALVQESAPGTKLQLTKLLGLRAGSSQWSDAIVLALIRMGYSADLDFYRSYIRDALEKQRPGATTLLAKFARLDPEFVISAAARRLNLALIRESAVARNQFQALAYELLSLDPRFLVDLVRAVGHYSIEAGKRARELALEYLSSSFAVQFHGQNTVRDAQAAIRAVRW